MNRDIQQHPFVAREAMATVFKIYTEHPKAEYARQAAQTALEDIARLETRISPFIEGSDISRLNAADEGDSLLLDPDVYDLLQIAIDLCVATGGAFDIAFCSSHGHSVADSLLLEAELCRATVLHAGTKLDVGGIGKGFALDCAVRTFNDWEVSRVLMQAVHSTLLALDAPADSTGWKMGFGPPENRRQLHLVRRAFSGSGTAAQGAHIINPQSGKPVTDRFRTWAEAPTAAEADALSTAFMVMKESDIADFIDEYPQVCAYLQDEESDDARIKVIGSPG